MTKEAKLMSCWLERVRPARSVLIRRSVVVGLVVTAMLGGALTGSAWASDASTAKTLVLKRADVGSAYTGAELGPSSVTLADFALCVGRPVPNRVVTANVRGLSFTDQKSGSTIASTVDIVKTRAMALADRAVVSDPKFPGCLEQSLNAPGASAVAQLVNLKKYGTFTIAHMVKADLVVNGQAASFTDIDIYIHTNRAEIHVAFVTVGTQPFDQKQAQAILDKLNVRIKAAKV